jgi:Ohr subfamily peroxiredoxin
MQKLYTTSATATGARGGSASTDDGRLSVNLSVPTGLGGDNGPGTNPEQLFALAYSACFQGALGVAGKNNGVDTSNSTVKAEVSFLKGDAGFNIGVSLFVNIPGVDPETTLKLAQEAHQICPYSNATRGNVDVQLNVAQSA